MFSRGFCSGSDPFSSPRPRITSKPNQHNLPGKHRKNGSVLILPRVDHIENHSVDYAGAPGDGISVGCCLFSLTSKPRVFSVLSQSFAQIPKTRNPVWLGSHRPRRSARSPIDTTRRDPPERKMIQMIQMIQMIVFSRFLFLARPAHIGPRVDCIGAELAHPAGTPPNGK